MGGWSHNFGSFVHVFDGKRTWRSVDGRRVFERIRNAVPKTTQCKAMCKFGLDLSAVQNLKTDMFNMTADTLNFFLLFVIR